MTHADRSVAAKKARKAASSAKYYKKNAERIAANKTKNREKNAERTAANNLTYRKKNLVTIAVRNAAYRKKNAVTIAAQKAEYRRENAECVAVGKAKWSKKNPEKGRAYATKSRTLKLGLNSVDHETPMPADNCCPHCRVPMTGKNYKGKSDSNAPRQDHIIALKPRTGEPQGYHVPENTMMICNECNNSKGNRPLEIFLKKPIRVQKHHWTSLGLTFINATPQHSMADLQGLMRHGRPIAAMPS
jgi:hypothetical protein